MKRILTLFFTLAVFAAFLPIVASAAATHHKHISGPPVYEIEYEATCTKQGSYKYNYYCIICDKLLKSDKVRVDALGHNWQDATCTTPKTCLTCGKTKGEAYGHTTGEAILEVEYEPTCTEKGSYKYNYYCTVCEKFLKFDRVKVDALGHNWAEATCTVPETCLTCGETNGEAPGHTMGEAVLEVEYEPTCTEKGSYKYNYYCTVCEKFLKFDRVKVDALGHNWAEATCTVPETCLTCGESNGEAPGHTMGEAVLEVEYEPTCTEEGSYKYNYYCTVCEKFLKFDRVKVDALGHDWAEATCTADGYCKICGIAGEKAQGHVPGEAVVEVEWEPTCTESGRYKYNYYCEHCGKFLKFDRVEVPATGHDWKEATMMDAAQCKNCHIKTGDSLFFQYLNNALCKAYACLKESFSNCSYSKIFCF